MDFNDVEISILITDDEEIHQLNKDFRGKDKPTNVLSFPMMDENSPDIGIAILGDLVISEDTASREAKEASITLDQRMSQLLIHGILHLIGYDHETGPEDEEEMNQKSMELIALIEQDKDLSYWM